MIQYASDLSPLVYSQSGLRHAINDSCQLDDVSRELVLVQVYEVSRKTVDRRLLGSVEIIAVLLYNLVGEEAVAEHFRVDFVDCLLVLVGLLPVGGRVQRRVDAIW